jgi:oxalate---CoA ligase
MHNTLTELLARGADDAVALSAPGRLPLTHGGLRTLIARTLERLNALGIGRGDRVAIVLANGPEMATCYMACASGVASAPLNPAYRADEFEFYLSDLDAKALIVERDSTSPAIAVASKLGVRVLDLVADDGAAGGLFTLEPRDAGPGATGAAAERRGFAQADDISMVLHTSGTTSRPKIVPLSQRNLAASAQHIAHTLQFVPGDRGLNIMPLFHIHGLIAGVLAPLAAGSQVFCTPGFNALKFFGWMDEARPTWYTAVPTMHQAILTRAGRSADVIARHPLRFLRSSSSSMPPQVIVELEKVFGAPLIESYGMTEATHQMASNPLPPAVRKPGTVGIAAGPEIAIMAPDGTLLGRGETGEIVIRGPNVTAGLRAQPGGQRRGLRPWLVPHRRPGRDGRRRLPQHHRPAQGDHQPRRREDQPARGRRDPDGPPGGGAGGVLRHAASQAGRGGGRRRGAARGAAGQRARAAELRRRPRRRLQGAEEDPLHGRDPEGRHRQAAAHRAGAEAGCERLRSGWRDSLGIKILLILRAIFSELSLRVGVPRVRDLFMTRPGDPT